MSGHARILCQAFSPLLLGLQNRARNGPNTPCRPRSIRRADDGGSLCIAHGGSLETKRAVRNLKVRDGSPG
jgi:hypothetical protein